MDTFKKGLTLDDDPRDLACVFRAEGGGGGSSSRVPEVLLHPFLQLFGDLLFLPFGQICHKHSRVEGALSGVNGQVFHFLFPVVQEAHVGGLWKEEPWFTF